MDQTTVNSDVWEMVADLDHSTPETALWTAVIKQAYDDVMYYLSPDTKVTLDAYLIAKRAKRWIDSNSQKELSFLWAVNVVFGHYGSSLELAVINEMRRRCEEFIPVPPKL